MSLHYNSGSKNPMFGKRIPPIQRFLPKVKTTRTCWLWTGGKVENGYGIFAETNSHKSKFILAHRFAYKMFVGPIPKGLLVLHKCDNPSCVRPSHLWIGTYRDNILDAISKGRHHSSEPLSKATKAKISRLRRQQNC